MKIMKIMKIKNCLISKNGISCIGLNSISYYRFLDIIYGYLYGTLLVTILHDISKKNITSTAILDSLNSLEN